MSIPNLNYLSLTANGQRSSLLLGPLASGERHHEKVKTMVSAQAMNREMMALMEENEMDINLLPPCLGAIRAASW